MSLSPDDPPLLTALAAGHVTITAGTAAADVTVFAGPLPLGTVIWSNPGNGSGVNWIVPAVPSTTGVADVFAFQADGTVQAITSDGSTAWTADVSGAYYWAPGGILPDFQGGLVAVGDTAIWKLDGITGQPYPAYSPGGPAPFQCGNSNGNGPAALHPDGTIIAVQCPQHTAGSLSLVGIDPTAGGLKFSVPIPVNPEVTYGVMIAGDGYAYFPYSYIVNPETGWPWNRQFSVFRVNSSGVSDNIDVFNWTSWSGDIISVGASMITNADQGILLTWGVPGSWPQMAITTGAVATIVSAPLVPGNKQVYPVLQAQDGSFLGTVGDYNTGDNDMVAFDATGNVRWIVPNESPQIATADGGVIGQSGITYDQYGNATGMIPTPTYSWTGNAYTDGPVDSVVAATVDFALSFNAFLDGSPSANGTAVKVVMSPMFVPFSLTGFPTDDFSIILALNNNFDATKIALYPLLLGDAKASVFQNYLARTNVMVGYIDHGLLVSGLPNAFGLCFADTCLAPTPLLEQCQLSAPGTQTVCLPNGFQPKSKLVMLAICGVDEAFIGQWHLPPTGQALIVPVYSPRNTSLELSLGWAAAEWQAMLQALANGGNVQAAVAAGNAKAAAIPQTEHTWQIIGDPFVTFHAQSR